MMHKRSFETSYSLKSGNSSSTDYADAGFKGNDKITVATTHGFL